jgi:prephenate dehydrogenase
MHSQTKPEKCPEAEMSPKRKTAGTKAAATRKHRAAGKKAAATRKHRAAGQKAAKIRMHKAAAKKAASTRARKKQEVVAPPVPMPQAPNAIDSTEELPPGPVAE